MRTYFITWCPDDPEGPCNPCGFHFKYTVLSATQASLTQLHYASLTNNLSPYKTSIFIPFVFNDGSSHPAWTSVQNLYWDSSAAGAPSATVRFNSDGVEWLDFVLTQPGSSSPPPFGTGTQSMTMHPLAAVPTGYTIQQGLHEVTPVQSGLADGIYYMHGIPGGGLQRTYTFNQVTSGGVASWWMFGAAITTTIGGLLGATQDLIFDGTWSTSQSQPLDATANSIFYGVPQTGFAPTPPSMPYVPNVPIT